VDPIRRDRMAIAARHAEVLIPPLKLSRKS
jgi:hypothetical protein